MARRRNKIRQKNVKENTVENEHQSSSLAQEHFGEDENVEQTETNQSGEEQTEFLLGDDETHEGDVSASEDVSPNTESTPSLDSEALPDASEEVSEPEPTLSTTMVSVKANTEEYERRMARGKPQDLNAVFNAQRLLYSTFISALTASQETDLREAMNYLYACFREDKTGAFSPVMVNRGLREMADSALDRSRAATLRAVINIMLHTLDASTREDRLQHLDVRKIADEIDNQEARNGLLTYLRL